MIDIQSKIDISEHIEEIIELGSNQIAIKIKNPIIFIDPQDPFRPQLTGFHNPVLSCEENVVFVHSIPQYYHNILELFPRLLLLKETGHHFKVVFICDNLSPHGITYNMFKKTNRTYRNMTHVLDFVLYSGIDFVCMDEQTVNSLQIESAIFFFNKTEHIEVKEEYDSHKRVFYKNEWYSAYPFLGTLSPNSYGWAIDKMRDFFPSDGLNQDRKIFISRSGTPERKFSHESEIEDVARSIGYEVVCMEDMHLLDQISLIRQASRIICEYGSGLVNTIFCSSTSKVLSINHTPGYYVPYNMFLSHVNVDYTQVDVSEEEPMLSIKQSILNWETS